MKMMNHRRNKSINFYSKFHLIYLMKNRKRIKQIYEIYIKEQFFLSNKPHMN